MTALAAISPTADGHGVPAESGIDRVIRVSTAMAVLAVAGVAAYVSYWHAYAVVRAHGESGITARLEPATIDGLVYASSMVVLYAARHRIPVPSLARWLLGLGIAATLTANMAQGWSHGPIGAAVAAWPAVSLVGSYELLVWLIRTAGALEPGPGQVSSAIACSALGRSLPTRTADGAQRSPDEGQAPDQTQQSMSQPPAQSGIAATEQYKHEGHDADTVNEEAVTAYKLSAQAGNPLSERKLAQMFGHTSRRWARARIAETRPDLPAADVADRAHAVPLELPPVPVVIVRQPVAQAGHHRLDQLQYSPHASSPPEASNTPGDATLGP
jgi:Protein of unknown function (DUF2637)